MYHPYPASGPVPEPPRPVRSAVHLMYAGAALEAVALIIALVTISSLKLAMFPAHPAYTRPHTAEIARAVPLVVGALITIFLWLWMAWANRQGLGWARVLSATLFGINTLGLLISLLALRAPADLIVDAVIWLVGLAAVLLIFSKDSTPFYN